MALVTGKWRSDPTEDDTRVQLIREKGLKENYWKAMLEVGTKYERHDGSSESALLIVQRLLQKPVMLKREPGWVRERLKIIEEQEKKKRMAEVKMSKSREQLPQDEEQPKYKEIAVVFKTFNSAWKWQTWLFEVYERSSGFRRWASWALLLLSLLQKFRGMVTLMIWFGILWGFRYRGFRSFP